MNFYPIIPLIAIGLLPLVFGLKKKAIACLSAGLVLGFLLSGCGIGGTRIKGGSITHKAASGAVVTQSASQDPKDRTSLATTSEQTQEIVIPSGSVVTLPSITSNAPAVKVAISSNTVWKVTTKDTVTSGLGASNKNTAQDIAAKLSSLRFVTYIGVVVFLFGAVSLFYPPLKVILLNSTTTSLVIMGAGLFLTFGPVIIVGNTGLILFGGLGAALAYVFIYRHSAHATTAKLLTSQTSATVTPANTTTDTK